MTEYRGFGRVHGAREGLTQVGVNGTGRQTKGVGVAVGARKYLLQLLRAGVDQTGELTLVAFGDEYDWRCSHFHDGEGRDGGAADGVLTLDVEGENVSGRGATRVATLDGASQIGCLGE